MMVSGASVWYIRKNACGVEHLKQMAIVKETEVDAGSAAAKHLVQTT